MRLEILKPRHWRHDGKEMLKKWYTQTLGYVEGETEDFANFYPVLNQNLCCECLFTIYTKQLPEMPEGD